MKVKPYSMEAVARICLDAGLSPWQSVTAVAVAWAESGGNAYAVGINDGNPDNVAYLSADLGMWQTNTYWHPDIAASEAFDPVKQIEHVKRIAGRRSVMVTTKNGVSYRANGGLVKSGGPNFVGDGGAELFIPRENGTVIPSWRGYASYDWSPWNAYKAGAHLKFISPAATAVRAAGGAL